MAAISDLKLQRWKPKHRREEKKVILSTSRWTALSRCGVHILPILVSAAIISLNVKEVFIGIDFHSVIASETINIAFLQTAAKLQELLMVASLATIVFQLIRDELLYGDGVPLGLLGAGIDFSRLSFFWSREIMGSLRSLFKGRRKYRKVQLVAFLVLAGAIALFAGPSCAVLLVPQNQDWPAGGTPFFLNGAKDDFWPVSLTADLDLNDTCGSPSGAQYGICPGGGYFSLWHHFANYDHSNFMKVVSPFAKDLSGNRYYRAIQSARPIRPPVISVGIPQGNIFIVQPHLSAVVLLDQLTRDWWNAFIATTHMDENNIDERQAVSANILNPLVGVSCAPAQLLLASDNKVQFPTFEPSQPMSDHEVPESVMANKSTDHLQFSWIPFPTSYESRTAGALFQSAWGADNDSRLVVGCSVQARWVPAHLRNEEYTFWQGWYPKNISFDRPYPAKGRELFDDSGQSTRDAIAADDSWLKLLTPPTPIEGPGYLNWGPSTMESLLFSAGLTEGFGTDADTFLQAWQPGEDKSRSDMLASIVASVFADGLSKVNIRKMYNNQGSPSQWTLADFGKMEDFENLVLQGKPALKKLGSPQTDGDELNVEFAIGGLSYRLTLTQYLAMLVLILHMLVAASHTIWTIGRGKSSACWDSITEIVVLAQNSKPAPAALQNTAAGVQQTHTYAKKISIRPTKPSMREEADHVELCFHEEEIQTANDLTELEELSHASTEHLKPQSHHLDEVPLETSDMLHPSTWPTHRRHSSVISVLSSQQQLGDPQLSRPHSPLLAPATQDLQAPPGARVKDDHAYG